MHTKKLLSAYRAFNYLSVFDLRCLIYFKPCRNMACSTFSYEPFFECLHTSNFILKFTSKHSH